MKPNIRYVTFHTADSPGRAPNRDFVIYPDNLSAVPRPPESVQTGHHTPRYSDARSDRYPPSRKIVQGTLTVVATRTPEELGEVLTEAGIRFRDRGGVRSRGCVIMQAPSTLSSPSLRPYLYIVLVNVIIGVWIPSSEEIDHEYRADLAFIRAMNSESVDLIAADPLFNKGRDFYASPDSLEAGAILGILRW